MATHQDILIESLVVLTLLGKPPSPNKDLSGQAPLDKGFIVEFHLHDNSKDSSRPFLHNPTPYIPSPGGRGDGQLRGALPSMLNNMSISMLILIPQYALYQSLTMHIPSPSGRGDLLGALPSTSNNMSISMSIAIPQNPTPYYPSPGRRGDGQLPGMLPSMPNNMSISMSIPIPQYALYQPFMMQCLPFRMVLVLVHPIPPLDQIYRIFPTLTPILISTPHPDLNSPPPSKLDPPTPPHQGPPHTRPHSDFALPPPAPELASSTSSPPPGPATLPNCQPCAASTPPAPISTSTSTSASGSMNGTVQCSGWTMARKQCRCRIKLRGVDVVGGEKFCYQHKEVLMDSSGFYLKKKGNKGTTGS
ncbi:hypothetical protein JAAARDRAFT_192089 [Jaapia argillacea MUCL 33604]|uniref:Uncharacterized protein n=1 Tax=Jaapia argillacea MUCL 33604 TaxID=933084 RepID=A0A067QAG1_9AGAM|nr:hypothetical protein JAAARDRAFT_192089 [Jaapia argillacea MUCL 33604]